MEINVPNQTIKENSWHDYDFLQKKADEHASSLIHSLKLNPGDFGSFSVWTNGLPELICIVDFKCDENGKVSWKSDDSQSTL